MKAATVYHCVGTLSDLISIHAAREGGDCPELEQMGIDYISIHAAREGGDLYAYPFEGMDEISIHAAREGGDRAAHWRNAI